MKKILLLFAFIFIEGLTIGQTTDLIISEYIEGSGSNKALEIYNGTGSAVDLSNYQIWKVVNGGTWPEKTLDLSGTLPDGEVYVIYNSGADQAIIDQGDLVWGDANWNGDDPVGLAKNDGTGTYALIDAVGTDGPDPGSGWAVAGVSNATKNHTLVRKSTVCSPTTDWAASAGTDEASSEWIVYPNDDFSYIGSHTSNCGGGGVDNPATFTAETVSVSQIDLSWTKNGNGDNVMVAWSSDGTFGTPADGTTYAAGNTITGGGTVLYNGSATSYSHTGLNSNTTYYYKAWSVNGSTEYSSGKSANATTLKEEPSNHVANFTAALVSGASVLLNWDDNDGAVVADGYLIYINTSGLFTTPTDGTEVADDTDLSDNEGAINVPHGDERYWWMDLTENTTYYFKIYPYSNDGSNIDYKTDGTVPSLNATTGTISTSTSLMISEVADPSDNSSARFVEIYNPGSETIDFIDWYLSRQSNGGTTWGDIELRGAIEAGETFVVAYNESVFSSVYGIKPEQVSGNVNGTGDDAYFLYHNGDHTSGTLIDVLGVINEDGTGKAWEYFDGKATRKRSVGAPNSVWTASEWFIESKGPQNGGRGVKAALMTPDNHMNYVTWTGAVDNKWITKGNWDSNCVPDISMNVTIPNGTEIPLITNTNVAVCWDLTIEDNNSILLRATGEPEASIYFGNTASGKVTVRMSMKSGRWYSISAPVSGLTASDYYMNGDPDVWMKQYNETTSSYQYISDLSEQIGDAKGWMIWVKDTGDVDQNEVFLNLMGEVRSGNVAPANTLTRSGSGDTYGYNFIGNPYLSTIDWDADGWTKTNLYNAVYTYNDGNWASYVNGTGTNRGSNLIAMNQGFFVQVEDGANTGNLNMSLDIRYPYGDTLMKNRQRNDDRLIKLVISSNGNSDETVIKLDENATEGYDSQLDAHKLFSFDPDYPQIFSTANGNMSINTLPLETGFVPLDVKGKDGDMMTISAAEINNLGDVWLVDEYNGIQTDLTKDDYSFLYDKDVAGRFTLYFNITGVDNSLLKENEYNIFAYHDNLNVIIPEGEMATIEVFNLLGQRVKYLTNAKGFTRFNLPGAKYYVVRVKGATNVETKKIFIQ